MPRPRKSIRTVEINVVIPMDLSAAMDQLLWDPVLQKPKYGARSELVTKLLTDWVVANSPDFAQAESEIPDLEPPAPIAEGESL